MGRWSGDSGSSSNLMSIRPERPSTSCSIAAVERDTGLAKDTLRVWERRYGFPNPGRDHFGERVYSPIQFEKLRMLRRLIDLGYRPGKIVGLSIEQLQSLIGSDPAISAVPMGSGDECPDESGHCYDLITSHNVPELRAVLSRAVQRLGLEEFAARIVTPLGQMVGAAWARGVLPVFEEHLYSEAVQGVFRSVIANSRQPNESPKVLLTTVPNEMHGLGILVAEAVLTQEGCDCRSLGIQTPVADIVSAATIQKVDIVALSFSACSNSNGVLEALLAIRKALPQTVEIWVGGSCSVLERRAMKGIAVLSSLSEIRPRLQVWRQTNKVSTPV